MGGVMDQVCRLLGYVPSAYRDLASITQHGSTGFCSAWSTDYRAVQMPGVTTQTCTTNTII
jgi:hypothetical protein